MGTNKDANFIIARRDKLEMWQSFVWLDTGTHDSSVATVNLVQAVNKGQRFKMVWQSGGLNHLCLWRVVTKRRQYSLLAGAML